MGRPDITTITDERLQTLVGKAVERLAATEGKGLQAVLDKVTTADQEVRHAEALVADIEAGDLLLVHEASDTGRWGYRRERTVGDAVAAASGTYHGSWRLYTVNRTTGKTLTVSLVYAPGTWWKYPSLSTQDYEAQWRDSDKRTLVPVGKLTDIQAAYTATPEYKRAERLREEIGALEAERERRNEIAGKAAEEVNGPLREAATKVNEALGFRVLRVDAGHLEAGTLARSWGWEAKVPTEVLRLALLGRAAEGAITEAERDYAVKVLTTGGIEQDEVEDLDLDLAEEE